MKIIVVVLCIVESLAGQIISMDSLGRAVSGYDITSYYSDSIPSFGDSTISLRWGGVEWLFSSAKNRDTFSQTPELFIPQYGGFCSWGMRYNGRYNADHTVYVLVENKLYFNQDPRVHSIWLRRQERNIIKADENWLKMNTEE